MTALPRPHPLFGSITLRRTDWELAISRHAAGWTVQEALAALPFNRFYQPQYDQLIADWPRRKAFLSASGAITQLQVEQALFDYLSAAE